MEDEFVKGTIFGIQRFSIHDGPGIRTTVFLKGCDLHCLWCHNPEGIDEKPQLSYAVQKCINCGLCVQECPYDAHQIVEGRHILNRSKCVNCGQCSKVCPTSALEIIGNSIAAGEVVEEVLHDKRFYYSGGGITLSGGEPMLQKEFVLSILRLCKSQNIHRAIETNGTRQSGFYKEILPLTDLFLFDYKITDRDIHKEYTGVYNNHIKENIGWLCSHGANVIVRCPIIQGINDTDDHFKAIAELTDEFPSLAGVEILSYHNLGTTKAKNLGIQVHKFKTPDNETVQSWKLKILEYGGSLIHLT